MAQKILLLGSGELGRELTISLQRLGCYVVACDSYPDAPAMRVADESRVFDMTDPRALRTAIAETAPDLVVPEVEKLAVDVLAAVPSDPDLHRAVVVPNTYAVQATFNRETIRELAATTAGVPTSDYRFASSASELATAAAAVGFPCFVKPTMSSSGHGQSLVTSPAEVAAAWQTAQDGARAQTGRVIVESKVEFDVEITLLTVRSLDAAGKPQISFCEPIGHRQLHGDYVESWQPEPLRPDILRRAQEVTTRVITALAAATPSETMLGIFGVELFVAGDEVIFSELSPRPHDTGMVTSITQDQSEFDLHARAILGLPVNTALRTPGASAVIKSPIAAHSPAYLGLDSALAIADDVRIFRKPVARPGRRMGVVLARGEVSAARDRATAAAAQIQIVDQAE
ncbi:MAG: formate-dependent phosphoribosylglycinamide formyltransferase [Trueperella sp.]|nr:formate-dependent phosphoribosylglycinamide formyltransferase [Trueperella sp.]